MDRLRPGSTISHYRIKERIAKGGMGEVYKAVDLRLGRVVAVKVLNPALAGSEKARRRFLREARAASILSHPSICTIFEVGQEGELSFIIMEYVEGQNIKELLKHTLLPVDLALTYAAQVADALDEAHRKGIIHRDIKPSNIVINQRGIAVMLDFGLAKHIGETDSQDEDTPTMSQSVITTEASILGTMAYMSPEQVRGHRLDGRSDIFSFGTLLYEMLTGQLPFQGPSQVETLHAVLHHEPEPVTKLRPEVDAELAAVVHKALRKEAGERYQSAAELRQELLRFILESGQLSGHSFTTHGHTSADTAELPLSRAQRFFSPRHQLMRRLIWGLIGAALLAGALGWVLFGRHEPADSGLLSALRLVPIANWKNEPGDSSSPGSFSHNGHLVVFASTKGGDQDLWVKQIAGGEPVQVTKERSQKSSPVWSADDQRLAFVSDRGGQVGIWTIPALGGTPSLLKTCEADRPLLKRWSKDGRTIYYESLSNLFALDVDAKQVTQLTNFDPSKRPPQGFSVSPDEDRIAYLDRKDGQTDIWVVPRRGGEPARVTNDSAEDRNVVWHPDGKRIIYSSNRTGAYQIYAASLDGRQPVQITFGESDSLVSDVSADGGKILYYTSKEESDLWGVSLETRQEVQHTSDIGVELWPDISPDGEVIAFQATREPSMVGTKLYSSLVLAKPVNAGGQQVQLAANGFDVRWSPDGKRLAFLRFSGNLIDLWAVRGTGGEETRLTTGGVLFTGFSVLPSNRMETSDFNWSPDGRQLAYCSKKSGRAEVCVVSADGANETQISGNTDPNAYLSCPLWSPDGKRIAYLATSSVRPAGGKKESGIWVIEAGRSSLLFQADIALRLVGWSNSGQELIVASAENGGSPPPPSAAEVSLFQLSAAGGSQRPIADLRSAYLFNLRLSPDGRRVAFVSHQEGRDDIYVVPAAGGEAKKVTSNHDPRTYFSNLAWAPDGRTIYFGKQASWSLISMIEGFR